MKIESIPGHNNRFGYSLFMFLVLVMLTSSATAEAYTIPSARTTDWSLTGSTDWSTTRTTICATLAPSGGNDTTAITNALSACPANQVVKLAAGTFRINAAIQWPKNSVTLRGSGQGTTTLLVLSTDTDRVFDFYNGHGNSPDYDWTLNPSRSITAGLAKGSISITTSVAHGWVAGDYVLIDILNDAAGDPPWSISAGYYGSCTWCSRANGTRLQGQVVRIVTAPTTNTATFTPPLYADYNPAMTPQGVKASGYVKDISIESMTIDNSGNFAAQLFYSYGLYNSLFYDLDITGVRCTSQSAIFFLFNSSFNTFRHSSLHNAGCSSTNNGYGIFLHYGCSANRVEDNIMHDLILTVGSEGVNSGNVIAHNYAFAPLPINGDTTINSFTIMGHGGGTFYNLYEGNTVEDSKFRVDAGFGSQHRLTFFRNRVSQKTTVVSNGRQNFDVEFINYYFTIVGNVLGIAGYETVSKCFNDFTAGCDSSSKDIYRIGYNQPYSPTPPGDARVESTMLRHYNWDSVTNGVKLCTDAGEPGCQGGTADTVLPTSLYLFAKPSSWWCTETPYPAIGPDLTPTASNIPAKRRYLKQVCTVSGAGGGAGGDTTAPDPPKNLQVLP